MMFGLMFIDMESFNELKQTSGYGVVLQKDLKEWNVVVEALMEWTEQVCEKKIERTSRKRKCF